MTDAYLCLADRGGLKTVLLETELSKRQIASLMEDRSDRMAFWTVLDPLEAQVIDSLLEAAEYSPALYYLESKSRFLGRYA
jgi:hypothetical protein